ncbi:hypothetical protein [Flavobacterium sp.]|nr:hypothetical protein [Flavobacterium sp.]
MSDKPKDKAYNGGENEKELRRQNKETPTEKAQNAREHDEPNREKESD